jgi:short-subunit dehydrogenase
MVTLITGASAGIGRALAVALAQRGCRLVLSARREARLQELNAALGGAHLVLPADVGKPEDCHRLVESAWAHFGRVDTLVLNAGYGIYKRVEETTPEDIRAMYEVDVIGTTECIRAAVPRLRAQSPRDSLAGQIVIVSSGAARCGAPFIGVYSGAKAAQLVIAEALRAELHGDRIAVTTVHPTPTRTEFRETAQTLGTHRLPPSDGFVHSQTADEVAAAMVAAIERPRSEVWPLARARWLLGLGAFWPGLKDRALRKYYDEVVRFNRTEPS